MSQYQYLLETKTEYTNHLTNLLTPSIYEGIQSIYKDAINFSDELEVLKNFQEILKTIPKWNEKIIQNETSRIIKKNQYNNIIDELIKSVIKANIILLTNTPIEKHHTIRIKHNITTESFIHNCYIEVGRNVYNSPYLMHHKYSDIELKKNQNEMYQLINNSIKNAIMKMLPLNVILKEYIGKSFNPKTITPNKEKSFI